SLLQLLLGNLHTDSGSVDIPAEWRIAHMAQEVFSSERSALQFVLDGDNELRKLESELEVAEREHNDTRLAQLHQQMDSIGGYTAAVRAEQLLMGLNFTLADIDKPVASFSGGWRIRLNLAQALMCPSDLLLLDEPTNHLDMDASVWLEQWLRRYSGTLLLISHDRDFIDTVCDLIVHIEHHRLNHYRGNYSAFERQRAERLSQQQADFEKQQRRIAHINQFVSRFRAKATKAKQAQSRLKELERMELLAPAHIDSPFDFEFLPPGRMSDPLLNLAHAHLGYQQAAVLEDVSLAIHPGGRIGLLGQNGAGKTTFIKSLALELPLLAGDRMEGEHLRIGYFSQHQLEALDLNASPALHLQRLQPTASEQRIRNFLGGFSFRNDKALESIASFSGGEKARLALAIIVWQKPNLLLLDEPTNHLDLEMRHALSLALQEFEGAMLLVSHDRHLLRNTVDQFLLVDAGRVSPYAGDLDDYKTWLLKRVASDGKSDRHVDNNKTANKKLQRQAAAELRQQLSPLRKNIRAAEQAMQRCNEKLAELEQELAREDIYEDGNKNDLQRLLLEQGKQRQEVAELEESWLSLSEELEKLEAAQESYSAR
ncbi:MAG: ATP-binding cassette domain-containing protein, partial [Pseudomonadales bacterium]